MINLSYVFVALLSLFIIVQHLIKNIYISICRLSYSGVKNAEHLETIISV